MPLEHMTLRLESPRATRAAGQALGGALPPQAIVLLAGGLGCGKTTLAKAVCEALGIAPALVTSPTYTLVNVYPGPRSVYHVDLFRLEQPEALLELDREDWINPEGPTLIEWPEHARPLLAGEDVLELSLTPDPARSEARELVLFGEGTIYGGAFAALRAWSASQAHGAGGAGGEP